MRAKGEGANYGISAGGSVFNSPVQSGNANSVIGQTNALGGRAEAGQDFAQSLAEIRREMAAQSHLFDDVDQCLGLLDAAARQRLQDQEERTYAKGFLKELSAKCGGAPGIASLIASALTLLATFQS